MPEQAEQSVQVTIKNPMGFHVRPVHRFAVLARLFKSDVTVGIGDRTVKGTSIIELVSLGGRPGDTMQITVRGEDAAQCARVLVYLAESRFFVEDDVDVDAEPDRHLERLATLASFFKSDIKVTLDGRTADAKQVSAVARLGLDPTDVPQFEVAGEDAEQAAALLANLAESCFYVEDKMAEKAKKAT